jgi:hypothetical protein
MGKIPAHDGKTEKQEPEEIHNVCTRIYVLIESKINNPFH